MKYKIPAFLFFVLVAAPVFSSSTFGQYIIVGTAFERMTEKQCGIFDAAINYQFYTTNKRQIDRKALYDEFKKQMQEKYPKPKSVIFVTSSEPYGHIITTHRKLDGWPCKKKTFYTGFGKSVLEATEAADKAFKENCRNCVVEDRLQLSVY